MCPESEKIMAIRFQSIVSVGSRTAVAGRGRAATASAAPVSLSATWVADPASSAGDLLLELPELDLGSRLQAATVDVTVGSEWSLDAVLDGPWNLTAVAGDKSALTTVTPLSATTPTDVGGLLVYVPRPSLQLSAAAASSADIATGDETPVVVSVGDSVTAGRSAFGVWIDDADDVEPRLAATTAGLLNTTRLGGYGYTVTSSGGVTATWTGAVLAGASPHNVVYIDSTDIGNGGARIPAAVTANTAEQYAFHPSVFIRRGPYIRSYIPGAVRRPLGITTPGGAATLMVARYEFTHSKWRVLIDGEELVITISHNGTLYTRPGDIWNEVIAPRFMSTGITIYQGTGSGGVLTFSPLGQLERFDFLQYAEFITGYNGTTTAAHSPYAQTGNPSV